MPSDSIPRRSVLASTGGLVVATAGCIGADDDDVDGNEIPTIELLTRTPEYGDFLDIAELIQPAWEELGLDVELNAVSGDRSVEIAIMEHDYDAFTISFSANPERLDPGFLEDWHSRSAEPGAMNFMLYENAEVDDLIDQANREVDEDARRDLVFEIQEILAEEQPATPLLTRALLDLYDNESVQNPDEFEEYGQSIQGIGSFWAHLNVETDDGSFLWAERNDVRGLNPLRYESTPDVRTMRMIYDRPIRIDVDGNHVPWVITEWEWTSTDTLAVEIRDDHTFHDGEPVTAHDLAFSLTYNEEHSPIMGGRLDGLEDVQAESDTECTIQLDGPAPGFVHNVLARMFLIPEHIWEDIPADVSVDEASEWENPEPIGCGPYEFDSWRPGEEVVLTANEDHFNPPNTDRFVRVEGSLQAVTNLLETQDITAVGGSGVSKGRAETLGEEDHINMNVVNTNGWYRVTYNNQREPFDDVAFRRALANAIPKQDINDIVMYGYSEITHSPVQAVAEFWHNPDVEEFGDDIETARNELEEAGYTWDGDGNLHAPE